jgi:hypothetical protein
MTILQMVLILIHFSVGLACSAKSLFAIANAHAPAAAIKFATGVADSLQQAHSTHPFCLAHRIILGRSCEVAVWIDCSRELVETAQTPMI